MISLPLHYQLKGVGETVTFIHGNTLDSRLWEDQVTYFAKHFQVLTYDLRGYGRSPIPTTTYNHESDLVSLLNQLDIKKTALVGISLGGEIALDFTLQYPERVSKVCLVNSSLSGYPSTVNWDIGLGITSKDQAVNNWLHHPIFDSLKNHPQTSNKVRTMVTGYSWHFWTHKSWYLRLEPPAINRLGEIPAPTLIMCGALDLPYFHDIAAYLHQNLPHSKYIKLANVGHLANLENPGLFNRQLENFLRSSPQIPTNTLDAL